MSKYIHVSVAWPYANGDMHVGHLAGSYLPADIFARYHRLKGNHVLMVSGSDSHGTPILVEADNRGVEARDIFEKYHARFVQTQKKSASVMICIPILIPKIIMRLLRIFSESCLKMGICTKKFSNCSIAKVKRDFCRIGMSKAPVISVAMNKHGATNVIIVVI
jgi:hypothetical protein